MRQWKTVHFCMADEKPEISWAVAVIGWQRARQKNSRLMKNAQRQHRWSNREFSQAVNLQQLQRLQFRPFCGECPSLALVHRYDDHQMPSVGSIRMRPA